MKTRVEVPRAEVVWLRREMELEGSRRFGETWEVKSPQMWGLRERAMSRLARTFALSNN